MRNPGEPPKWLEIQPPFSSAEAVEGTIHQAAEEDFGGGPANADTSANRMPGFEESPPDRV